MSRVVRIMSRVAGKALGPAGRFRVRKILDPPRFDGFVRIYPTLACNLRCSYCVNYHNPSEFRGNEYELLSSEMWSRALNRIGRNVIITGGEPFLYAGLVDLLNTLREDLVVKIYTSFSVNKTVEIMDKVIRPVIFYGSYHSASGPPDDFLSTVNKLRKMGKFQGTIHGIGTKEQKELLFEARKRFADEEWDLKIDEDQRLFFSGASMRFRRSIRCIRRVILVAPDGTRYQCVSRMVRRIDPLGPILDKDPEPERVMVTCHDFGYCAPCDCLGETTFQRLRK